jgi:hypothetical protein
MSAPPDAAAPAPAAASTGERVALTLALAAAAVGVILVLFHVDYLPTLDGPYHLLAGYLENHFDDPGAAWPAWLQRGSPYTALGFHLVFSFLERLFAWRTAFQLTLVVLTLAWGFGYLNLVRALHPRRAALGLLGFATSISWTVYMGFFSFAMSIAMGFTTLALAASAWPWTPRRRALLVALLLVQAVAHAFGAALTGLVLLAIVLVSPLPGGARARAREIALLASMGLPALLIAATASGDPSAPTVWLSLADHFRVLPATFLPGPTWRAWTPLLLGLGGVAFTIRRLRRGQARPAEIALAGAAVLHLALAFAAPMDLAAWKLFSPRFLPFGCLLGAALLPLERLDARRRLAVLAGLSVFTMASLSWAARAATSLRARADEALSGLSAPLHRTGPRLEVALDAFAAQADSAHQEIPFYAPLLNLGPLYAIEQGGISPFGFLTNPRIHPFVLSAQGQARYPGIFSRGYLVDPRIQTDPAVRAEQITYLAMVGAPFEDLIFQGRPEDGELLIALGYAADFRRGGLFLGHLEGCPVTARVVTPASQRARVFLQYSAEALAGTLQRSELPPAPPAEGAEVTREVKLSPPLCGPMWLRVSLDRDGSGGPSKGDAFCEGADAAGRVHLAPRDRHGQVLVCRIAL